MAARDACWWLSPWKKLDQEWQAACARGQQQLAKVADSVQKTTLDEKRRQRYEMILLEVLSMYEHELVAKSLIASDIFECFKHETVTIYLASWQMQPHIDRQRLEELETLIQNDLHYQTQKPRR
ncbi:E3 ubiquitin-protein ligase [Phytophthora nicotianae]|uniref:E3 ubiquitin-protein ligase n=1 Tax=Phytophthora nicotianae TaxID=4792 RepID=A0A0W8DD22_PHYNI|nr:E3 ubiquitin-protein ligase [Phytophthora nicotianae]